MSQGGECTRERKREEMLKDGQVGKSQRRVGAGSAVGVEGLQTTSLNNNNESRKIDKGAGRVLVLSTVPAR